MTLTDDNHVPKHGSHFSPVQSRRALKLPRVGKGRTLE
jgi:hypothetical protein